MNFLNWNSFEKTTVFRGAKLINIKRKIVFKISVQQALFEVKAEKLLKKRNIPFNLLKSCHLHSSNDIGHLGFVHK